MKIDGTCPGDPKLEEDPPGEAPDRSDSLHDSVEAVLASLTLEEKVSLCHAGSKFATNGVKRLGIPPLVMSDGPHGVRQEFEEHGWTPLKVDWDTATYLPTGTALAATWNPELARSFGRILGAEARARGKDVILGPGFNIVRDPRCGRNFEYLGEDPCLIRALVPEVIRGIQEQDVAACAKHFAMNNQEWNRGGVDARPDERTFREIYAPGFEAAVAEGGVWTVMGAYNKFHGEWCCQNKGLLNGLLKGEWKFAGPVISDWCAVHGAREAALGGLDIEMGTSDDYARFFLADPFLALLRSGEIPETVLDDKVRRILRVHFWTGKMGRRERRAGRGPCAGHSRVAGEIASEAPVLLKNEGLLPLDAAACRKVAVIGENAIARHAAGGGSSGVKSPYELTPLDGIRHVLGGKAEIRFARGYPSDAMPYPAIPAEHMGIVDEGAGVRGWQATWTNAAWIAGVAPVRETRQSIDFLLAQGSVPVEGFHLEAWSASFVGTFRAPESGRYVLALRSDSDSSLTWNGERRIELRQNHHRCVSTCELELQQGQICVAEIAYHHGAGDALLQFGWCRPGETILPDTSLREEALLAARDADVVLFFGGLNHLYDNEGGDRSHLRLPGGQDDLVRELVKVNPRTVVTLIAGSPVEMPWRNEAPAILFGWYAGLEAGRVYADILFGRTNPSGKLPFTLPLRLADVPACQLEDYNGETCRYREGIFTGYRWYDRKGIEPLYPFGFGLGYSSFSLESLEIAKMEGGGENVCRLSCRLRNTGRHPGKETVQVYVGPQNPAMECAVRELKAFRKVYLEPGETSRLEFVLNRRDFSYWNELEHGWKETCRIFEVGVGTSSRDIKLSGTLAL